MYILMGGCLIDVLKKYSLFIKIKMSLSVGKTAEIFTILFFFVSFLRSVSRGENDENGEVFNVTNFLESSYL